MPRAERKKDREKKKYYQQEICLLGHNIMNMRGESGKKNKTI
jgi:hypothetical protein